MEETKEKVSFAERATALEVEVRQISSNLVHVTAKLDVVTSHLSLIPIHDERIKRLESDIKSAQDELKIVKQTVDQATGGWKTIIGSLSFGALIMHLVEPLLRLIK